VPDFTGCLSQRLRAVSPLLAALLIAGAAAPALSHPDHDRQSPAVDQTASRSEIQALRQDAQRAQQAGDPARAAELYRRALAIDPNNDQAYDALVELANSLPLDADSDARRAARQSLAGRFVEHQTRRYVVFSDADRAWALAQAEHLERTHHQFQRQMRLLGVRPLPLRHKLVCILFQSRQDYQDFAMTSDGVSDPWISGYYSPKNDWIVFYQTESNPSVSDARVKLQDMGERIRELERRREEAERRGQDHQVRQLREVIASHQAHMNHEQRRVNQFATQVGIATTVHEATHQLLFHTGVQSPYVQYPLWICEGLATAFETDAPNQAFGPDREFAPRREVFVSLLDEQQLLPLRELVGLTDLTNRSAEEARVVYHQSYALVQWMWRSRREPLRQFLESMRSGPGGRATTRRLVEAFESCFGDLEALERAWLRHERAAR
jgi:tetratricopeptide (TPR) repeat protein